MKISIQFYFILLLLGCNQKESSQPNDTNSKSKISETQKSNELSDDSSDKLNEVKLLEEIEDIKRKGIVGKWECDFSGY